MLILKQCQNLREWGLPQNKSRSYYRDDGKLFYCNEVGLIWADEEDQFACPDLEQLLEFAKRECRKRFFVLALDDRSAGGWSADGGWIENGEKLRFSDPDPKEAIYKLLEQIIEPNNKVDDSGATEDPLANTVKLSELDETKEEEDG